MKCESFETPSTSSAFSFYIQQIVEMVEHVQEAFTTGLPGLEWMDPATKETAMFKATEMIMKIGYPDFVADATELDEHYESVCNVLTSSYDALVIVEGFIPAGFHKRFFYQCLEQSGILCREQSEELQQAC
jgi:inactivated superfamily I helicase